MAHNDLELLRLAARLEKLVDEADELVVDEENLGAAVL